MFSLIGCRIEQLQLETAERIKKALGTYAIVAIATTLAHEPKPDKIQSFLAIRFEKLMNGNLFTVISTVLPLLFQSLRQSSKL